MVKVSIESNIRIQPEQPQALPNAAIGGQIVTVCEHWLTSRYTTSATSADRTRIQEMQGPYGGYGRLLVSTEESW